MGLKDVVERLAGRKPSRQLGSRRAPDKKRQRDEQTVQVPSPASGRTPPPLPPAPPPAQRDTASHRAAPTPAPPPPAPRSGLPPASHVPPSSPPARPAAGSAEATMYTPVPRVAEGALIGVLVGIDGELRGQVYKIYDREMKLGRAQDCDVNLLDAKISREHARLIPIDGDLMVKALSERNPVLVNDQPIAEVEQLSDGDKLQLGNPGSSIFRFRTIEGA